MDKIVAGILIALILVGIGFGIYWGVTPAGKAAWNTYWHGVQTADDRTNYNTLKKVEDTCRAMIASYESDKLIYEQYKDSTNESELEWAAQAKMRANKTAVEYNNYILKNNYVWKNAVPSDIYTTLGVIE